MTSRTLGGWIVATLAIAIAAGIGAWRISHPPRPRPKWAEAVDDSASAEHRDAYRLPRETSEAWSKARAQIAETMRTAPQRLSPHAQLDPFDADAFARDPDRYLSAIEPARCFQTARPGPDVPVLDAASP